MKAVSIRPATRDDVPAIMRMWTAAAERLHAEGHDQWNYPERVDNIHRNVDAGTCWMVYDGPEPVGTITVDDFADPRLWTPDDAPGDALYVHRLVLTDAVRGLQLGSALLDWAAARASDHGRKWLRLDAWTSNSGLQAFYTRHGFEHVRTVTGDGIPSGALFQRDASIRIGVGPAVRETPPRVTLTDAQAERALTLCEAVRSRPGMWIAHFDWYTADAFWTGYFHALHEHAVSDFRTWGLAHLGTPESNTDPIFQLRRLSGLPTDHADEASYDRPRATEIANLVCDLVAAYIEARRQSDA